jgi:hypothetical protein
VYTRLLGSDETPEFSPEVLEAVLRCEAELPAPAHAVLFAEADGEDEDDIDQIVVCKRYAGVLIPMVYVGVDELAEYESQGYDWIGHVRLDLERTEQDIEAFIAAEESGEEPAE